jgi:prevent-host-death family protein
MVQAKYFHASCHNRQSSLAKMYIVMYIVCMVRRYSIAEARSQLPAIIDQAESGLEVELTRRGEPVAVLVSTREFDRLRGRRQHFSDAYQRFVARHGLKNIGVDAKFSKAIRDQTPGRHVSL